MRILAIRGENLASLEQSFEVDLTTGPLGRAGLFAITGPTGAGKSTLLDAICLCLYDTTPRLADRGGAPVRLEGVEDPTALAANDQRNILRRGAGEGWAEVDFTARDGSAWTSRWSVRRARLSPSGNVQGQALSLRRRGTAEDEAEIAGNKTEVLAAIRARVGLDFEQFRRSVLLAQGDFAAFLRASETERATLLEQMTGTGVYTELSKAAYGRDKDLGVARAKLVTRLEEHGVLDAEAREAAEAAQVAAEAARQAATDALAGAQEAVSWHTKEASLQALLSQARGEQARTQQARAAAEGRRAVFVQREAAWPLRAKAAEVDARTREARAAAEAVGVAAAEQAHARAAVQAATEARDGALADAALERVALRELLEARRDRARARRGEARAWLADRPLLVRLHDDGRGMDGLLDRPEQQGKVAKRLDLRGRRAALVDTERPRVAGRLATAREAVGKAQAAREAAGAGLSEAEAARAAAQAALEACEAKLPEERVSAVAAERRAQERLVGLSERAADAEARRVAAEAEVAAQAGRAAAARAEEAAAAEAISALGPRLDEAEGALRRARAAVDATDLRSQLVDGEPCPVCGSEAHPWAEGSPLAGLFGELEGRVATLRAEQAQQQAAVVAARAGAEAAEAAGKRGAAEVAEVGRLLEGLAAEWAQAAAGLPEAEALAGVAPGQDAVGRRPALDALGSRVGTAERLLRQDQSALSNARTALQGCQSALERARRRLDGAVSAHEAAKEAVPALEQELQALDAKVADLAQRIGAIEAELAESLAALSPELDGLPGGDLSGWAERLDAPEPLLRALEAAREEAGRQARLEREAGAALDQLQQEVPVARREAELALAAAPDAALTLRRAARSDLEGPAQLQQDPPALSEWLRRRAEATAASVARTGGELEAAGAALKQADEALAAARAASSTREQARAAAAAELAARRGELGLDEAVLTELVALADDWLEQERRALADVDSALEKATVKVEEREGTVLRHTEDRPELDAEAASAALTAAREARKAADEAWSAARSRVDQDDRARRNVARLEQQLAEHDERAEPWRQLARCIGQGDGTKFKRFAQSLTLELLLEQANAHLAELHPRYRLARIHGTDLDILVVDGDLGDEPRTVRSLSGGESFLVSLALALGLSSLSSKDVRVESLFIDEGFGTLDARSLDTALSVLDSLQAEGRQVGVISHVGGLAERIGVRVSVEPQGGGRSKVSVLG